ncbi:ABC transporter, ATP-binding protein [[Eubacterium] yurii subsp. margaretiae ATCC 43715]|nr:ABC transporter, ATP-binding protein [[Eubacterium] yurii subsp. margaretiae ATCC 43715]
MEKMANLILSTENLGITFGGLKAVSEVNLNVYKNEIVGLIGPNGAGKTTVFNMLTGVYEPTEGKILLNGTVINGKKPHDIVSMGIARTFQNIRLFKALTVAENVAVAFNKDLKSSIVSSIFRTRRFYKEEKKVYEKALNILKIFSLEEYANEKADNLPYGKQRKLEIARAMATSPQLLLLDEPAAGMNDTETAELMQTIATIREKFNISILLIEHDMNLVLGICEKLNVLEYGRMLASGNPQDVIKDEKVIRAYLGDES